ncbi:ketopantoate reductase family protein [Aspergillus foveolatus]|uniref:ketopantoate reductase family protein n=1 Tax=Aspergillus foveolatus TaxID=210207 RepID=UPI003CCD834F
MFARPLLRAAASELCGFRGPVSMQVLIKRPASTWTQDVDEIARESGQSRLSGRIHILGVGNIGTFVAHSLASRPSPPPITLLMHNPEVYQTFQKRKQTLAINSLGLDDNKTGFDVNVLSDGTWRSIPYVNTKEEEAEQIECLIVSVKAPATVSALESVRHRLTPKSTVLFIQNGMGITDAVNERVFPDPGQRPHYMLGIISHGLAQRSGRFHVTHTGVGTTILGPVPSQNSGRSSSLGKASDWAPSTKYLLRTLTLTPPLVAVAEPPSSIMLYQLEKLAMNSVINPLTALMDCRNGELLYNYSFTRVMRLLLLEISNVICSLPELQGIPGVESRFSPERLRWMVTQLASKTAKNHSSMLQDIRANRTTEIEFLNGYIVRKGEELGIKCVVNYTIKHLVLAKQRESRRQESSMIPIDIPDEPRDSKL